MSTASLAPNWVPVTVKIAVGCPEAVTVTVLCAFAVTAAHSAINITVNFVRVFTLPSF